LDYLSDAHKVKVLMRRGTSSIEQTLVLHAYSAENAAYGLRSDKLQLLAGDYAVVGYTLYDNLDREIGTTNVASQFTVVPDGLIYHNLSVEVTPRGKASFRLVKPESFTEASSIADNINEKRTVVLNLESTNMEIARRLVDFLVGVAYANGATCKKVASKTFIFTPKNTAVIGEVSGDVADEGIIF
jgi:cell division inhibitor SepF